MALISFADQRRCFRMCKKPVFSCLLACFVLQGVDVKKQADIDNLLLKLDGTDNKCKI